MENVFETTNQYITMVLKWDGINYIPTIVDGFAPLDKLVYKTPWTRSIYI